MGAKCWEASVELGPLLFLLGGILSLVKLIRRFLDRFGFPLGMVKAAAKKSSLTRVVVLHVQADNNICCFVTRAQSYNSPKR